MITALFMIMASPPANDCVRQTAGINHTWLSGDYAATPVVQNLQGKMRKLLHRSALAPIPRSLAQAAIASPRLPANKHYYLAKVGYFGQQGSVPAGLSLSVDVNSRGVAYVTSFRLTSDTRTSELVAVISSQTALKGLVSQCRAAE